MNGKLCCLVVLSLVCGACANAARTLPTPEPTLTPTLEPTPVFIDGQSGLPTGKYMFAESEFVFFTSGECPMLDQSPLVYEGGYVPCVYRGSNGGLFGWGACKSPDGHLVAEDGQSAIKGFVAQKYDYFGSGDDNITDGDLTVVKTLPYSLGDGPLNIVIHSISSQGGIVATVCGQTRLLEPGQTMTTRKELDAPYPQVQKYHSCHLSVDCRFTNRRPLDDRQIEVTPMPKGWLIEKH